MFQAVRAASAAEIQDDRDVWVDIRRNMTHDLFHFDYTDLTWWLDSNGTDATSIIGSHWHLGEPDMLYMESYQCVHMRGDTMRLATDSCWMEKKYLCYFETE